MSNYSKIYWLTRLDYFSCFMVGFAVILFILAIVLVARAYIFMDKDMCFGDKEKQVLEIDNARQSAVKTSKRLIPIGVAILVINLFIPTKNEVLLIMAGGKTLDYVQSDTSLSKIPYQTTQIISNFLDKQLKDLKADKK